MGMRDKKIFTDALPADGSAQLHDATNAWTHVRAVGAAGARHPRRRRRRDDVSHAGFPFLHLEDGRHRRRPDARVADLLRRRARLGDLRPDRAGAAGLGRALGGGQAARPRRRSGIGTYAVTARLEKGYRAHGAELELDFDLVEAGMARPTRQGRRLRRPAAYLEQRSRAAGRRPVHADRSTTRRRRRGVKRYMLGREPILTRDGAAAHRREGPPLVRDVARARARRSGSTS